MEGYQSLVLFSTEVWAYIKRLLYSTLLANCSDLLYFLIQERYGMEGVAVAGPRTVMMASALFTFATAFVVPFYTTMIVAPRWEWVSKDFL